MPVRHYPRAVTYAAQLLGAQIREGRIERKWTIAELAERAGVTEKTVRNVERGHTSVALGTAFDCAVLVGVPLFFDDERRLAAEAEQRRATVISRRARPARREEIDLDF
jgi:transcriptional regulator with XRE-family HTH domain